MVLEHDQAAYWPKYENSTIDLLIHSPGIPLVSEKTVRIENQPGFFLRLEPDSIHIGKDYASGPTALVLLRYAAEWMLWNNNGASPDLCDFAAAKAAYLYLTFFSPDNHAAALQKLPRSFVQALQNYGSVMHPEKDIAEVLAAPTEYQFIQGGDERLYVSQDTGLNVYGCLPYPRNYAYTFASSTATSVSNYAYAKTEGKRQELIKGCLAEHPLQSLGQEVADKLKLSFARGRADCEVMISPSGTDSQLHAVAVASTLYDSPLISIVVASDETGRGTPYSVTGRHFADVASSGSHVHKGEPLEGMPEIDYLEVPIRYSSGEFKPLQEMDREVYRAVADCVQKGYVVLLHTMDQSKLGCWAPSTSLLDMLQRDFSNDVQLIVDACQTRLDQDDVQAYLKRDGIVLLTGSKFFTGPPFSGAALFSEGLVKRMQRARKALPQGLSDYIPDDYSLCWEIPHSRALKGSYVGIYLRWWAALAEFDRYHQVPERLRCCGLDYFCSKAEQILARKDYIELMFQKADEHYSKDDSVGRELSCRRTIFPFRIKYGNGYLDPKQMHKVYHLLNHDISNMVEGSVTARSCHVGQPLRVSDTVSVLRISAGARIFSQSWLYDDVGLYFKKVDDEVRQIKTIVQKIGLILEHGLHLRG